MCCAASFCLFFSQEGKSFDACTRMCAALPVDVMSAAEVKLCVGTRLDLVGLAGGGKDHEVLRRRALDWTLDHGFELVEADCTYPEKGSV